MENEVNLGEVPGGFKTAEMISVTQKTLRHQSGLPEEGGEVCPLSEKIDQYLVKLGYSNAHVLGIVVNLLTVGKVRVEFRHYSERLELADPLEKMTRGAAVDLFDRYLLEKRGRNEASQVMEFTGKIVVQPRDTRT